MQIRHSPEKLLDVILMPAVFLVLFLYVFGGQPKLRQPSDRGRGERGVRDIGQCRAAPSAQRLGQQRRGFRPAPVGQRAAPRADLLLKGTRVHAIGAHHEPVAGRAELHGVPADRAAQSRDQRLHGVRGVSRPLAVPQVLSQPVDGHRPAVGNGEPDQQGAQPGPADGQQGPGVVADLERPQDTDLHSRLPRARRPCPLSSRQAVVRPAVSAVLA